MPEFDLDQFFNDRVQPFAQATFKPLVVRAWPEQVTVLSKHVVQTQAPTPAETLKPNTSLAPVAVVGACVTAFGALAMVVSHRRKRLHKFQAETIWKTEELESPLLV